MKVKELLEKKSRPVHTIAGDQSVARAVDIMSGRRTSALIVTENEQPIGIFTERDLFGFTREIKRQSSLKHR
jgi:CBS domain-containing protein